MSATLHTLAIKLPVNFFINRMNCVRHINAKTISQCDATWYFLHNLKVYLKKEGAGFKKLLIYEIMSVFVNKTLQGK